MREGDTVVMHKLHRSLLGASLTLIMLFFVTSALAAEKRVALIVANSAYKNAALQNPTIDAVIVASSLKKIGFLVTIINNADLGGFDSAVNGFVDEAKGADIALFYFAGHGFAVNEGVRPVSVLMSTSADVTAGSERVLRAGGIPLADIVESLAGQAKATLIFVDACRNDPRISRAIGGGGRGFGPLDPVRHGSLFIGLSTRIGDTAEDGEAGKGSPFARAFAANVQTKGTRIDDAFREIRDAVKIETVGKQVPDVFQDDLPNGAITLVSPAEADGHSARQGEAPLSVPALDEMAWSFLENSDNVSQLRAFVERFPLSQFRSKADARIETLNHAKTAALPASPEPPAVPRPAPPPTKPDEPKGLLPTPGVYAGSVTSQHRNGAIRKTRSYVLNLAPSLDRGTVTVRESNIFWTLSINGTWTKQGTFYGQDHQISTNDKGKAWTNDNVTLNMRSNGTMTFTSSDGIRVASGTLSKQ